MSALTFASDLAIIR